MLRWKFTKVARTKINPVIRVMVASDFLILFAFGLLGPIFAIFLLENIQGGSAEVAGFASMIWLVVRAIFQIPVASFMDRHRGERDDFWLVFFGSVGSSFIPIAYLFALLPIHIYAIQTVYGFLSALAYPSWMAIFTRHIDHRAEGFEWSIYNATTDIGMAVAAGIGGMVAVTFGFRTLFVAISLFSLVGSLLLLKNYPLMRTGREGECWLVCEPRGRK